MTQVECLIPLIISSYLDAFSDRGIAALAGIPGGLAFFLSEIRRPLLKWFGGLFLLGALIQIVLLEIGFFGIRE